MTGRLAGILAVVHPFPSALNAIVVLALVIFAGGSPALALSLALAMLLIQFAIGAANDYFDAELDTGTKPAKPIPSGLLTRRDAAVIAFIVGTAGLLLAALPPGAVEPQTAVVGALILADGLAYDAFLKRTPLSWLVFSVFFPLLLLFAWDSIPWYHPPAGNRVLIAAVLAGLALQLANSVVDLERDRSFGLRNVPTLLGHRLTVVLLAACQITIQLIVWLTLRTFTTWAPAVLVFAIGVASGMSLAGIAFSAAPRPRLRETGWRLQALGLALLVVAWTLLRDPNVEPCC